MAASFAADITQHESHRAVTDWDKSRTPSQEAPDDGLQIKYMLSHWREITQQRYLEMAEAADGVESFRAALEGLDSLQRVIGPREIDRLWASFKGLPSKPGQGLIRKLAMVLANHGDPSAVHRVLKKLGDAAARKRAGPTRMPKVLPILPHPLWRTGRRGIGGAKMADYDTNGLEVHYRGVKLQPGDMLLVDSTDRADGLMNSFSRPRSHFTHSAMVAFVGHPKTGKRVPVAFEVHVGGLRIVPLNRYLSPDFSAYAEIYRPDLKQELSVFSDRLNGFVGKALERQMGYDFHSVFSPADFDQRMRENKRWVQCATGNNMALESCGESLDITPQQVDGGAFENTLTALGLTDPAILQPTDLKFSKRSRYVGTVDNGFLGNVVRGPHLLDQDPRPKFKSAGRRRAVNRHRAAHVGFVQRDWEARRCGKPSCGLALPRYGCDDPPPGRA